MIRFYKVLVLFFLSLSNWTYSQCSWSTVFLESFEYASPIPGLVAGTTYQTTPQLQTFANCVRTGTRGMYMNIVNGYTGILYNNVSPTLCVGTTYRYRFSTRDAFNSTNNLTIKVIDANNTVLLSQNVINNSVWQDITMPSFVATTPLIRFQIFTNTPGGTGNDVGFDDLRLEVCNYSKLDNVTQCQANGPVSLYAGNLTSISSQNGTWTGPSALQNGYVGTFTPGINANGNYVYTVDGGNNCSDSIATIAVFINSNAPVNLGQDTTICNAASYLLNPGTGFTSYLWNDGTTTATKNVTQSGTYHVKVGTIGPNMIVNSGFESGNTGFSTSYTLGNGGSWGMLSNPGTYAITTSPNLVHNNFSSCQDHTASPGVNMLVVNGASTPNTQVWCQTVPIEPATTYQFGTWVTSALTDPTVAQLQFSINGAPLGSIFSPTSQGCNWTQFTQNWTSGMVTSAQICIVNQNTSGGGNDFAIDDISFRPICYSKDTVVVTFGTNPTVNLGLDQNTCSTTPVTFNAQNPGCTYLWNNSLTTQTIQTNTSGTYSVTVTNAAGCSGSDQVMLTVEPIKTAGRDSTASICSSQLSYNLGNLLSSSATANGVWSSTNFTGAISPTGQIILNGTAGTYNFKYVVTGTFCPNDTANITLVVHPNPTVYLGPDATFCSIDSVTLNAQNAGASYVWNNSTTNQTLVAHTAGTYSVVVTNQFGCSKSDQIVLSVEPIKTAGLDSVATICSTQANYNLVSIRDNAATLNGNWYTTNFVGTLNANGTVTTANTPGQFDFQYVVTGVFCPNDTADFELTINQQPVALANSNVQFCNTPSALESLVTNFNNGSSYTSDWAYSTINLEFAFNEATQQLSVGNLNGGQYNIYQFLIADSTCINDTTKVSIAITQIPQVDFNSSVIEGCEPLSVTFNDLSNAQGNLTYFWDFGNGQTSTAVTGNTIVYPTPNCYTITLTVTADNLCTVTKQKTNMICVYEIPNAAFSFAPQQVFSQEPTLQFNNLSTLNASNFWSFGDGSYASTSDPTHDYPLGDVGDYIVVLQVTSIHGCVDTVSHIVTVKDQLLYYVPNTFTPDGDEHNNVFEAIVFAGIDQDEVSFEVYNRWGEVVFKTTDLTEGWDGTYNGLKCPEGTYAWVLRLGLSESEDVKIVNGAVNLIR